MTVWSVYKLGSISVGGSYHGCVTIFKHYFNGMFHQPSINTRSIELGFRIIKTTKIC